MGSIALQTAQEFYDAIPVQSYSIGVTPQAEQLDQSAFDKSVRDFRAVTDSLRRSVQNALHNEDKAVAELEHITETSALLDLAKELGSMAHAINEHAKDAYADFVRDVVGLKWAIDSGQIQVDEGVHEKLRELDALMIERQRLTTQVFDSFLRVGHFALNRVSMIVAGKRVTRRYQIDISDQPPARSAAVKARIGEPSTETLAWARGVAAELQLP